MSVKRSSIYPDLIAVPNCGLNSINLVQDTPDLSSLSEESGGQISRKFLTKITRNRDVIQTLMPVQS